ncbi:MAG: outer membrane beta-barrel protein [Bacteroidia bacterium]
MDYSSVMLLGLSDSIIYHTAFAGNEGRFSINNIAYGNYILLVTRPGYADFDDKLIIDSPEVDAGIIYMLLKENLLREVVVNEWAYAIRIKGDTTEFLADSFINNPNATVEDLLKKLPGIQVDRDGKITAQGETVKRVLVDGEEFFGDDPTIATRNLKAENVEKVQVFDSKSEQSILTGVDDGQNQKTINLTLKDEAKKGYFGKIRSAYGPSENIDRYENEAMLNSFNAKRKFSVFGTYTNTNQTGLNWSDMEKYGGGYGETEFNEEIGGVTTTYTYSDDEMLARNGIPRTGYLGTFFSNKYKDGKISLNGTLNYKNFNVGGFETDYTKYILPDTFYFNNQKSNFSVFRQQANTKSRFDIKLDSLSSLMINFKASSGNSRTLNRIESVNQNSLEEIVNTNNRTDSSEGHNQNLSVNAFYSKKFQKKGRSFSANLQYDFSNNQREGLLISTSRFLGVTEIISDFDQRKEAKTTNNNLGTTITYTEPITQNWFVVTDYGLKTKFNKTVNTTLEKQGSNYSLFIDSLSNNFNYDIFINQGGVVIKHAIKKLSFSFGGKLAHTNLIQKNNIRNTTEYQPFINLFPAAQLNYKIKNTSNFRIAYNGSTQQPTLQQIQPLQDNTNPLVLNKGNPNLQQSFTNSFSVNYNSYAPLKGRGFYGNISFNLINNAFSNYDVVNDKGVREVKTVNVNGNYSLNGYSQYYFEIKKLNLDISFNVNGSYNNFNNFINGLQNTNKSYTVSFGSYLDYELDEILEFTLGTNYNINGSQSSIRQDAPINFYTASIYSSFRLKLPSSVIISPELDYDIRQRTPEFNRNLNVALLNARISKKVTKSKAWEFSVYAYDILNQNLGFNRNANSNFINERTYQILRRYVLFGVTYHISGGGAKKTTYDDEDDE